jgi:hypothetical protein
LNCSSSLTGSGTEIQNLVDAGRNSSLRATGFASIFGSAFAGFSSTFGLAGVSVFLDSVTSLPGFFAGSCLESCGLGSCGLGSCGLGSGVLGSGVLESCGLESYAVSWFRASIDLRVSLLEISGLGSALFASV